MRHIVIIGNGIAGITAARHLRKQSNDRITVVSAETDHFFSRTALMYIYMGHMTYAQTKPYEDFFWAKNRIDLCRARVTQLDASRRTLTLSAVDGSTPPTQPTLTYDVLILATGSQPNLGDWPGKALDGVQGLYGKPDLDRMEASTAGIRQAVVVGGGLIGIELCEMLQSRGISVSFLIRESSFWRSVLPADESALVTRHIREHHITLITDDELSELRDDGTGRVSSLRTKAGLELPAQFVGVAIGVSPNIAFLQGSGLETDRGILVDAQLRTNLPDVYAIGDCVQHRNPPVDPVGASRKPLEQIWYTGRIMGETVAQTILGTPTPYQPGVFFNSAKFFDIEYQVYGTVLSQLPADNSIRSFYWEHPDGRKAMRINYRTADGAVVGMNALGIRQRQAVWQQWIETGQSIAYTLEHLPQANFDPEFFAQHEAAIIARYNAENPERTVRIRVKKGLFGLHWKRSVSG